MPGNPISSGTATMDERVTRMCGIAGWVSYPCNLMAPRNVIAKMTETMSRHGSDAGGIWIDRHVALRHPRLAVINLVGVELTQFVAETML